MAKNDNSGLLVMRITSGLFFLAFGLMKFTGLSAFAEGKLAMFGGAAIVVAFLVALGEAAAGLALLSGYYVKSASYLLAIIMAGAIILVHNNAAEMMNAGIRIVMIGLYVGMAQMSTNKCPFKAMKSKK